MNYQHDATLLKNGNILVFDNGKEISRVIEINPKTNKIEWEYDGGPAKTDKAKFYSPFISGARRLKNGNTLITDGMHGHIFEVTKTGKVVWDYFEEYPRKYNNSWPFGEIFKAINYESGFIKNY